MEYMDQIVQTRRYSTNPFYPWYRESLRASIRVFLHTGRLDPGKLIACRVQRNNQEQYQILLPTYLKKLQSLKIFVLLA